MATEQESQFYVGSVIMRNADGAVLLGKRLEDGIWTGPGGGSDEGESPIETLRRELYEEAQLNIDNCVVQELPTLTAGNGKPVFCFLVYCPSYPESYFSPAIDPDNEVKKWQWVNPENFTDDMKKDPNRYNAILNGLKKRNGVIKSLTEELEKAKRAEIGEVRGNRKKVAEGKWVSIDQQPKDGEAAPTSKDYTATQHQEQSNIHFDEAMKYSELQTKLEEKIAARKKIDPSFKVPEKAQRLLDEVKSKVKFHQKNFKQHKASGTQNWKDKKVKKSLFELDDVLKGRALPEGTIRVYGGQKKIKQGGKWVPYKESINIASKVLSEIPWPKSEIGWWKDNKPIVVYHGTDLETAIKISKEGFIPSEEGHTKGSTFVTLDPNTAWGYSTMSGGEVNYNKNKQENKNKDRVVLVITFNDYDDMLKFGLDLEYNKHDKRQKRLFSQDEYNKSKSDNEFYQLTEFSMNSSIPPEKIKGITKKPLNKSLNQLNIDLRKTMVSMDHQGTAMETSYFAEELENSPKYWLDIFYDAMDSFQFGDAPRIIALDKGYKITLAKVDDGQYSGFVRKISPEADLEHYDEGSVNRVEKMTIPAIIQFLMAKEYISPMKVIESEELELKEVPPQEIIELNEAIQMPPEPIVDTVNSKMYVAETLLGILNRLID